MQRYRYVIVGGGQSADAAVKGIRSVDSDGTIALISAEPHAPYERPPLSKALWMGQESEGDIDLGTRDEGVELILGARVTAVDAGARTVTHSKGDALGYDKLLLATGGSPRSLPGLKPGERVLAYRTLDDYRRARALAGEGAHVIVVGGGFIGAEMAAGLSTAGAKVTMVFPEAEIGAGRFPVDLAGAIGDDYRRRGIAVHAGRMVAKANVDARGVSLTLDDGSELGGELLVLGLGTEPNVELARGIGLAVDGGVHVDAQLRTAQPDIYACGDVMAFEHPALGRRVRIEHEDNAIRSGHQAGRNMAGAGESYLHVPFFYSDLFDNGYEAVGDLDGSLHTVADWQEPADGPERKGIVYYMDDTRLRGVLLWNTFGKVDAASALLMEGEKVEAGEPAL